VCQVFRNVPDEGGLLALLGPVPRTCVRVGVGANRRGLDAAGLHLEPDAFGRSGEFAQSFAARVDTFSRKAKLNMSHERGQLTLLLGRRLSRAKPVSGASVQEFPPNEDFFKRSSIKSLIPALTVRVGTWKQLFTSLLIVFPLFGVLTRRWLAVVLPAVAWAIFYEGLNSGWWFAAPVTGGRPFERP
jgi:hypothetical protein